MEPWREELYLAHHGILGMKWGKQNGPPYPLDAEDHSASEKKAGWRKSLDKPAGNVYTHAKLKGDNDVRNDKKEKRPGKLGVYYREGLKTKYLRKHKGKSEADAEKYADNAIKVRKALVVVGGVAIAAAAAYYAKNRLIPEYVDQTLKSGSTFKRVVNGAGSTLDHEFYMARSKGDVTKYVGYYGAQVRDRGGSPHQLTGKIIGDLKVASNKKAAETFGKLLDNDDDFRERTGSEIRKFAEANVRLNPNGKATSVLKEAVRILDSGGARSDADRKKIYEAFNIGMINHDESNQKAIRQFFDEMKKAGYGAINDVNDRKYSGYNTHTATIVFDTDSVVKTAIRSIENDEIDSIKTKEVYKELTKNTLIQISPYALAGVVLAVNDTIDTGSKSVRKKELQKQGKGKKKGNKHEE